MANYNCNLSNADETLINYQNPGWTPAEDNFNVVQLLCFLEVNTIKKRFVINPAYIGIPCIKKMTFKADMSERQYREEKWIDLRVCIHHYLLGLFLIYLIVHY